MRAILVAAAVSLAGFGGIGVASADHCWAEVPPCDWYPGQTLGPNPLCDPEIDPVTCYWPWFKVDVREGTGCVEGNGAEPCLETTCTLEWPPSRCGNAFVGAGFRP